MTTDVKLLPLSPYTDRILAAVRRQDSADPLYRILEDYARANMEPLLDENERLRAEVRDAYAAADSKAGWEWRKRAERLAEALQELVEVFSESGMYDEEVFAKARAALDQEGGNG